MLSLAMVRESYILYLFRQRPGGMKHFLWAIKLLHCPHFAWQRLQWPQIGMKWYYLRATSDFGELKALGPLVISSSVQLKQILKGLGCSSFG